MLGQLLPAAIMAAREWGINQIVCRRASHGAVICAMASKVIKGAAAPCGARDGMGRTTVGSRRSEGGTWGSSWEQWALEESSARRGRVA